MAESLRWTPQVSEKRSRLMAAMSYLGILCFVPLLFIRDDPFVNFHARQGMVLWIWTVLSIFSLSLPGLTWFFGLSSTIIGIFMLIGIVSAAFLQMWKLPGINYLAELL